MISSMREYFRSLKFILVIIIVAFVATSVIYFGSNAISGFSGKHNVIASVNGEEIPAERFRRGQANIISMYERASKQKITPEQAEKMGLNKQVMGDLVRDAMIVQSANREGIQVPDDELRKRIQEMKEFQVDGRFSRDQYLKLLRMARFEPSEFEAEMRRQILREKMENIVMGGAKVTEAELRDIYDLYYGRVKAEWASIEVPPLMAAIAVPDSEIEPYVKSHQAQFTKPERRRFEYVLVDPGTFPQPVPEQDIEAYYKEHGAEFDQPKRVHVAHVLVRVPPVGGSEAENGAKAKVEAVIKRAQAGEDFAKIAKSTSEDTANAAQGGDLGWISAGELVPQFEQAAFALKKGEVSPAPVRTPFGYHAIKVLDTKEGGRVPLKEVAPKIKDKLSLERGDIAARDKAEAIRKDLLAAPSFIAEAKKLGFEARDATIAKGEPFGGIGRDPALEEAMFSLSMGGVSAPVKTRTGYAVVKAVAQIPAGVPPLAELKPQVVEAIKRERAEAQAVERAKALIASLAKGGDFAAAAKAAGFTTGQIPFFSRAEPPKDRSGAPNSVLLAALQTAAGQVAEPVKAGTSVFVVKTLERQPPDAQGFDKQRAELEKQLTEQKRRQFFESWLRAQRASTKVEVAGQLVPVDAL